MLDTFIWVIIIIAGIAIAAYLAKWIITDFFPPPVHMPAMLLVGVVLLIAVIIAVAKLLGGQPIGPPLIGR
jgi:hypothetical protein